jgi:urease subunit gamma/beta
MRLLPRESDRLQVFLAAELVRRRRGRGLRLNQAEAAALIADEVMERARDGLTYEDVERAGYTVLAAEDVLDGVAEAVDQVEVEALFRDGSRLLVLEHPILRDGPPPRVVEDFDVSWSESGVSIELVNEGEDVIGLTSHVHLFEVNRQLRFHRADAWGMRLALKAGEKLVLAPGERKVAHMVPIGGSRVVVGHGGLVEGPLDAPGARERGLERARERGYLGA